MTCPDLRPTRKVVVPVARLDGDEAVDVPGQVAPVGELLGRVRRVAGLG